MKIHTAILVTFLVTITFSGTLVAGRGGGRPGGHPEEEPKTNNYHPHGEPNSSASSLSGMEMTALTVPIVALVALNNAL